MSIPMPGYCDFTYVVKGSSDVKEGIAILNNDTVQIKNGRFQFKGSVTQPMRALLMIQPPGGLPADLILEQGEITVTMLKGQITIGGTPNNIAYQQIRNQTASFRTAITALQEKSYAATGLEKRNIQLSIDSVNKEKVKVTGQLIRKYSNLAGLLALQSTYRKEKPSNLVFYLDAFKKFAADPAYQLVADFYKSMMKAEIGFPAPPFTLQDLDGKMISLGDFKGKYVLVDFWYHNCGFCRKMAPGLRNIYADLQQKGFEIVSISIDGKGNEKEWRDAIKEDGATWTELWDYDKTMPDQYGVVGYPHMFLLDKDGKLLQQIIGYTEEAEFRRILRSHGLQ